MKCLLYLRKAVVGLMTLVACLLTAPIVSGGENGTARPLKAIEGHMTITLNPVSGAYVFTDWGSASHTGLFVNEGTGFLNASGQFVAGSGVVTAADGDQLFWTLGAPNTVVYTGGTGRFSGATGGFPAVITSQTFLSDNGDGTITLYITYTGTGTITY